MLPSVKGWICSADVGTVAGPSAICLLCESVEHPKAPIPSAQHEITNRVVFIVLSPNSGSRQVDAASALDAKRQDGLVVGLLALLRPFTRLVADRLHQLRWGQVAPGLHELLESFDSVDTPIGVGVLHNAV